MKNTRNGRDSIPWRPAGWIFLTISVAFLGITPVVAWFQGSEAWSAAAIAAPTCLVASISGLIAGRILRQWRGPGPEEALLGMLFRMGIPLVVAVVIAGMVDSTFRILVLCLLAGFYLIVLPVDIWAQLLDLSDDGDRKPPPSCRPNSDDRPPGDGNASRKADDA
jgi:hypothetical protein